MNSLTNFYELQEDQIYDAMVQLVDYFPLLTKYLAGISLDTKLPGEDKPPYLQTLSTQEKGEKEKKLSDQALDQLNGYWDSKVYDGYRTSSTSVYSAKDNENYVVLF